MSYQSSENPNFSAQKELFVTEVCLKNYNSDVIQKITQGFSGLSLDAVMEFGAGIGALAHEYHFQTRIKPDCVEIDGEQMQIIQERGFVCFGKMNDVRKKYDAIYTSNVLEHIEDDVSTLKELYAHLREGGRIAIYVPALMCLWSQMDEAVGHYRRYSRKDLCHKVALSGFKIMYCHYADSIGFFASLCLRFKGYKPGDAASLNKALKFFDRIIYPVSRIMDFLGLRYFFGKNLLLIAEKKAPDSVPPSQLWRKR